MPKVNTQRLITISRVEKPTEEGDDSTSFEVRIHPDAGGMDMEDIIHASAAYLQSIAAQLDFPECDREQNEAHFIECVTSHAMGGVLLKNKE